MVEIIPNWHPIFVHFTIAMVIVAAAIHLLSHFLPKGELADQLTQVARWNLRLGAGFTLFTVAAGWYAFNTVRHDTVSHIAMTEHRNWAMATFALLLGIAGWEYYLSRCGKGKGRLFTVLLVVVSGLLATTAWHGSELVYRHGLGVMSMPQAEGHTHGQGEGHDEMDMHGVLHDEDGHAHSHDDAAHGEHEAVPGGNAPVVDSAVPAPKKDGHTHAPGTLPHKD